MDGLLEIVFTWMLIVIGRLVLRIGTLGRWKCESIFSDEHRLRSAAGSLSYVHEGRRVVTSVGQSLAGFIVCVALVAFVIAVLTA